MQRIQTDADVLAWRRSEGYNRFLAWIEKRSQRIRGRECVLGEGAYEGCSEVSMTQLALDEMRSMRSLGLIMLPVIADWIAPEIAG